MGSIWKLNGADIYVDDYADQLQPQIAELNPIDSTASIFHYIYTPDQVLKIQGTVIGSGYLQQIKDGIGEEVTMITDLIPGGITVLMETVSSTRVLVYSQRVDMLQPDTTPVYKVSVELRTAN